MIERSLKPSTESEEGTANEPIHGHDHVASLPGTLIGPLWEGNCKQKIGGRCDRAGLEKSAAIHPMLGGNRPATASAPRTRKETLQRLDHLSPLLIRRPISGEQASSSSGGHRSRDRAGKRIEALPPDGHEIQGNVESITQGTIKSDERGDESQYRRRPLSSKRGQPLAPFRGELRVRLSKHDS